jgi:hypothetical protein
MDAMLVPSRLVVFVTYHDILIIIIVILLVTAVIASTIIHHRGIVDDHHILTHGRYDECHCSNIYHNRIITTHQWYGT